MVESLYSIPIFLCLILALLFTSELFLVYQGAEVVNFSASRAQIVRQSPDDVTKVFNKFLLRNSIFQKNDFCRISPIETKRSPMNMLISFFHFSCFTYQGHIQAKVKEVKL